MPRYYLDLFADTVSLTDDEGERLAVLQEAEAGALVAATEILLLSAAGSRSVDIVVRKGGGPHVVRFTLTREEETA